MSVADLKLEQPTAEKLHARPRNLFSRLVEAARMRFWFRGRLQTLQDLPDSVLMDIGVHRATIRDPFLLSTPLDYPLLPGRKAGR